MSSSSESGDLTQSKASREMIQTQKTREKDRSTMKLIVSYLVCEMQITDEHKAEKILKALEEILNLGKSSS